MPEVQTEEPAWVQRMRARGYDVRRGTLDEPMSEEPEVMFPPPMHPLRRALAWIAWGIRKVLRLDPSPYGGRNAPFP